MGGHIVEAETSNCVQFSPAITDEWFSYDADGRPTDAYESIQNAGGFYHSTASSWANGGLKTLSLFNSSGGSPIPSTSYGIDGEGRPTTVSVSSGQNPVTGVTYTTSGTSEPIGSLTQVTFGSTDSDTYQYYTTTGRMKQYSFNVNGQSAVGNLQWNANGTMLQLAITDPFNSQDNQTCNNTYDDLARLNSNQCGSVWGQTFSYDAFGNITKSGSISWQPTYTSPSNNKYQSGWNGVSYDGRGDLLNDTFNTYTWDAYGDLASANGATITYDAFGRMVANHNGTYQYVYSPAGGSILASMSSQSLNTALVPLPGGAFAVYNPTGLIQYNHGDWLGSARLFSTPRRAAVPAMSYAPFGEGYAGGLAFVQFTSAGNTWTVEDNENQTGSLVDFMFRRYSPTQGRWISPDPSGLAVVNPGNPQSWNRYAYVVNSPLTLTDPSGLFGEGGGNPCDWGGDRGPGGGGDPCLEWGDCGGPGGGWGGSGGSGGWGNPPPGGRVSPPVANSIFTGEDCLGCWSLGPSPLAILQGLLSGNLMGALQSIGAIPSDAINCESGICQVNPIMDASPENNEAPQNPCNYAGRNLDPSAWAAMGQGTKNNPFTTAYDFAHGFSIGGYLDAQPMATGSTYEKAAYGNYVYGAYMSAAGFPLSVALAGANEIAFYHSLKYPSQYSGRQMDSFFWSLPVANVANITAGYNAQLSGTLCHR